MHSALRKIAEDEASDLGNLTTLEDHEAMQQITEGYKHVVGGQKSSCLDPANNHTLLLHCRTKATSRNDTMQLVASKCSETIPPLQSQSDLSTPHGPSKSLSLNTNGRQGTT